MVSKVRNFWLCVFSGVVATTLILSGPAAPGRLAGGGRGGRQWREGFESEAVGASGLESRGGRLRQG